MKPDSEDRDVKENTSEPEKKKEIRCGVKILYGLAILFVLVVVWANLNKHPSGTPGTSDAFSDGYELGKSAGKHDGYSISRVPSRVSIEGTAHYWLGSSKFANASDSYQKQWQDGLISGYESGFKEVTKPAW